MRTIARCSPGARPAAQRVRRPALLGRRQGALLRRAGPFVHLRRMTKGANRRCSRWRGVKPSPPRERGLPRKCADEGQCLWVRGRPARSGPKARDCSSGLDARAPGRASFATAELIHATGWPTGRPGHARIGVRKGRASAHRRGDASTSHLPRRERASPSGIAEGLIRTAIAVSMPMRHRGQMTRVLRGTEITTRKVATCTRCGPSDVFGDLPRDTAGVLFENWVKLGQATQNMFVVQIGEFVRQGDFCRYSHRMALTFSTLSRVTAFSQINLVLLETLH